MFKVKATLTEFQYDEDEHPCHFNYKVGDQIFFDGERFEGRICPNAMATLIPVMVNTYNIGYKTTEYIFFRYRGADTKDPDMIPYDGLGYRPKPLAPVEEEPEERLCPRLSRGLRRHPHAGPLPRRAV